MSEHFCFIKSCLQITVRVLMKMIWMQVPMYSASGLRVQYLKVWEKSGYRVDKWVRKVCKSGDYSIRI